MTNTTTSDRIADFVGEVARHFGDLSEADRSELLDDLHRHLTELADDDEEALDHELVDPADYAAELRRTAGFPEATDDTGRPSRLAAGRDALRARLARARQHPWAREALDFVPQLRPAWWVLRGWVVVVAAAQLTVGGPWWRHVPVPDRSVVGLVLALAAVAVSVRVGRDGRDDTRTWQVADVATRVALVVLVLQAVTSGMAVEYVTVTSADQQWQPPVLRHPDGEPITNLYLFDEDGTPLERVFVYDGVGRPVEIGQLDEAGFGDIDTVYARRPDGTPMTNRYPLEQYVVDGHDGASAGIPDREPRTIPDVLTPGDAGTQAPADHGTDEPTSPPAPTTSEEPTDAPTGS